MKVAVYIEDGQEQVVLTPETKFEENIIEDMREKNTELKIVSGSFFECRGGYVRNTLHSSHSSDKSLIIRLLKKAKE